MYLFPRYILSVSTYLYRSNACISNDFKIQALKYAICTLNIPQYNKLVLNIHSAAVMMHRQKCSLVLTGS